MATNYFNDNAVFIPGKGTVLIGKVGANLPTESEITNWINSGGSGALGTGENELHPIGHTSLDELPSIETETEGGENRGSWQNSNLRTTPITTTDTITIQPIQFTEEILKHRFGANSVFDGENGKFSVAEVYAASEVSILIIIQDGDSWLAMHYYRASSAPEGGLEMSSEDFMSLPIKYTILKATGKNHTAEFLSPAMKVKAD